MDVTKIPNEIGLNQEKILNLAQRLFELLTEASGVAWDNPQDAQALLWASERASKALQSIIDCTDKQAKLYVMAAFLGESEWLEHLL